MKSKFVVPEKRLVQNLCLVSKCSSLPESSAHRQWPSVRRQPCPWRWSPRRWPRTRAEVEDNWRVQSIVMTRVPIRWTTVLYYLICICKMVQLKGISDIIKLLVNLKPDVFRTTDQRSECSELLGQLQKYLVLIRYCWLKHWKLFKKKKKTRNPISHNQIFSSWHYNIKWK